MAHTPRKQTFEVIVGNIGTVLRDATAAHARATMGEYIRQSKSGVGRAAGEPVTLMRVTDNDVEIYAEYIPKGYSE